MTFRTFLQIPLWGWLLFTSCTQDESWLNDTNHFTIENDESSSYLNLQLQTRTQSSNVHLPGENTIRSASIHIFNEDWSPDSITPYTHVIAETNVFPVKVTPGLKHVVVTANLNSTTLRDYDLSDWKRVIFRRTLNNPLGSADIPGDIFTYWRGIPMIGKGSDYVKAGESKTIYVDGIRLLSRINAPTAKGTVVNLNEEEKKRLERETGLTFSSNITFGLEAHIMINGSRSYKLFPHYGVENEYERWSLEEWMKTQVYIPTEYENGQLVSAYSGSEFLTNNEYVYVYENTPRVETYDEYGEPATFERETVYAFIIRGTLTNETGKTATRYWRVNLAKNSVLNGNKVASYQILRNAIYNTNIQHVLTAGYETPEEAEEEKPSVGFDASVEIDIKVVDWRMYNTVTDI